MEITKYIIKRITNYILSVLAILVVDGLVVYGFGIEARGWIQSLIIAVALLAYPAYRSIRGTVMVISDFMDESSETEENLFAYLCEEAAPGIVAGRKNVIFFLNMISKFMQMCFIGCLAYSFAADDSRLFVRLMTITTLIMGLCLALLIRIPAVHFSKQREREAQELMTERENAGILIDDKRRRLFMQRPMRILIADILLSAAGILQMSLMPLDVPPMLYHVGAVVRTAGILAMICLPGCIYYYFREHYRSTSFVVEIGKGEYGQIKVEFWQYEGSGDDREKKRNKIDRVESLTVSSRYIKILKIGQLWPVKIPRTTTREFELLDTLELMRS